MLCAFTQLAQQEFKPEQPSFYTKRFQESIDLRCSDQQLEILPESTHYWLFPKLKLGHVSSSPAIRPSPFH